MFLKFCGFRREEDVEYAAALPLSAMGFIFYKKSKRYITPERARELGSILVGTGIKKTGIFVNDSVEDIKRIADTAELDIVQIYDRTMEAELSKERQVILCHRISGKKDMKEVTPPEKKGNLLLFDAKSGDGYGGTGHSFDWSLLNDYKYLDRLIIAGGLNYTNVGTLLKSVTPYGIDLSSGIEISPGIKSREKIDEIMIKIKEATDGKSA